MKGLRRLLGMLMYLFMAFPLMLGGLSLASVRPLASDPAVVKSMVTDARFTAVLESPSLPSMAPESLDFGGATLEGDAAVAAFQAALPSRVIVSTAESAIDSAFAALGRGEAFFTVDARPFKQALESGARDFADAYIQAAGSPAQAALPAATGAHDATAAVIVLPEGSAGRTAMTAVVAQAASAQPDEWRIGDPGSRFEMPARIGAIGSGLAGASVWLLLTGAGLCFASVMVADSDWRKRLGKLGSRVLAPSIIVLVIGLVPHLVVPGGLVRLPSGATGASFPELAEYLRFISTKAGGGFLTAGLIGLGVGTALASAKRAIPPSEDEALD